MYFLSHPISCLGDFCPWLYAGQAYFSATPAFKNLSEPTAKSILNHARGPHRAGWIDGSHKISSSTRHQKQETLIFSNYNAEKGATMENGNHGSSARHLMIHYPLNGFLVIDLGELVSLRMSSLLLGGNGETRNGFWTWQAKIGWRREWYRGWKLR